MLYVNAPLGYKLIYVSSLLLELKVLTFLHSAVQTPFHQPTKLTLFITFTTPLSVCLELALARSSSVKFWYME